MTPQSAADPVQPPDGVTAYDPGEHGEWGTYGDWVATEVLGWCGCYNPALLADARAMLDALDEGCGEPTQGGPGLHYAAMPGKPAYAELLMLTLDRAGLVDHGTSVRYCWVTDWGRHVATTWRGHP